MAVTGHSQEQQRLGSQEPYQEEELDHAVNLVDYQVLQQFRGNSECVGGVYKGQVGEKEVH